MIALTILSGAVRDDDLHARAASGLGGDDIDRLPLAAPRAQGGGRAHVHPVGDRIARARYRLRVESDHLGRGVRGAEAEDSALALAGAAVDVDILARDHIGVSR